MKKIYYNGQLITMNDQNREAEALMIEDGIIKAVGSNKEVLKLQTCDTEMIDLDGKTMMPAFIDPHSHFFGVANSLTQCDLTAASNFDDIVQLMKEFIAKKKIPDGEWVTGCNYDDNFLIEAKHPTKDVLDKISTKHKIVIVHASSHMGVVNSAALAAKGIDASTKDPEGGRYARYEGGNEPNGFMEENAFIGFMNANPMKDTNSMIEQVKEAQEIYASNGITTVQDGMVAKPLYQLLSNFAEMGLLKLDVIGFLDIATAREHMHDGNPYINKYHKNFKLGGYKMFLDGSPQGLTAWMETPYVGKGDYCGYPIHSDEEVDGLIKEALEDNQQLITHCNGDAAAEQYIREFEKVQKEMNLKDLHRPVMIHAQLVRKDQLARMKKLDMIPSFFLAHTYYWGDVHMKNFGAERGSQISIAKDACDLGVTYTFHQDSPVVPPNMLKTIWCAVNRLTRTGKSIGANQKMDVYDALKAVTINAAYQYFEEDIKGSLEVNKQANLVILDQNPMQVNPLDIDKIKVLTTIKQGEVIYQR